MQNDTSVTISRRSWLRWFAAILSVCALTLAGCSQTGGTAAQSDAANAEETYFTTDQVHQINVQLDDGAYEEMLDAYAETGDKNWISTTVTIDGTTFEDVGLRLKGNSSLRQLVANERGLQLTDEELEAEDDDSDEGADTANPATISWLIRLNKYVDDQSYLGRYDFAVRGNTSESALNEAVAVAMLEEAGLATHRVGFTSFSINDDEPVLRLVSEVPDDALWNEDWFEGGSTWKADSQGDWDYHGEDGADYEALWKQRTGEDDMTPIVEFMDFINNSSDEEFEASLADKLDVEEFATYLAAESLMGNFDTISGPGNNGYLHFDPETGQMTVIPWDHNLAFGGMSGMGGMGGPQGGTMPEGMDGAQSGQFPEGGGFPGGTMPEGTEIPEGMEPPEGGGFPGGGMPEGTEMPEGGFPGGARPEGMEMPEGMEFPESMEMPGEGGPGGGFGGGFGGSNILETRFQASSQFSAMYDEAYARLQGELIDSGFALDVLNQYADLLINEASDLISPETVETERAAIEQQLTADRTSTPESPDSAESPESAAAKEDSTVV